MESAEIISTENLFINGADPAEPKSLFISAVLPEAVGPKRIKTGDFTSYPPRNWTAIATRGMVTMLSIMERITIELASSAATS